MNDDDVDNINNNNNNNKSHPSVLHIRICCTSIYIVIVSLLIHDIKLPVSILSIGIIS